MAFDALWDELTDIGRATSGGYRRFAWTAEDMMLREWFESTARARGMDVVLDRAGNQWAWLGDPDRDGPGLILGSHLDSVPDGGAFDGPLGVVSAFAALEECTPARPVAIVNFADEEGARFGVACAGSRLLTGAMTLDRARELADADGVDLIGAAAANAVAVTGCDPEMLARIGAFVELHVEQGRGLVDLDAPIALASAIWPHGRWRVDLRGQANHAGTTRLQDRDDPMLALAQLIMRARESAQRHGGVATIGKLVVEPNGVNAIASHVRAWLDARGPNDAVPRAIANDLVDIGAITEESWTGETAFDGPLRQRLAGVLGDVPVLATGAGHDAGILAAAGIPTAMIFVRNPTGISHSPAEFAEREDCLAGVNALIAVLEQLAG
jgi:beta-ureidopropionase / N-carbamoyl-L-amino-acid hydrolase